MLRDFVDSFGKFMRGFAGWAVVILLYFGAAAVILLFGFSLPFAIGLSALLFFTVPVGIFLGSAMGWLGWWLVENWDWIPPFY